MTRRNRRLLPAIIAITVIVAGGCAGPQPNHPAPEPSTSAIPVAPATGVQFDPQWMGLVPDQPQGWEELHRSITSDFQQFALRPVDDTEYRYGCNGCAPSTADLTAYAPGTFDPTEARTGRPVSVTVDGDGFVKEDPEKHAAMLTWQYAENAWATVRAMTSATIALDRMVELARALRPGDRAPIRLPLSMANLPAQLPLAEIEVDTHRDEPAKIDYGTSVDFGCSGRTATGVTRDCRTVAQSLSVRIIPGEYRQPTGGVDHVVVPMSVGGKDGHFDETINRVSVQVQPGLLALFDVGYRDQRAVRDILAGVTWAPDPGNEATWPALGDWTAPR